MTSNLRKTHPSIADELISLWKEYEENVTPEAMVVKDLDKFEMIQQAFEYERRGSFHGARTMLTLC